MLILQVIELDVHDLHGVHDPYGLCRLKLGFRNAAFSLVGIPNDE